MRHHISHNNNADNSMSFRSSLGQYAAWLALILGIGYGVYKATDSQQNLSDKVELREQNYRKVLVQDLEWGYDVLWRVENPSLYTEAQRRIAESYIRDINESHLSNLYPGDTILIPDHEDIWEHVISKERELDVYRHYAP